MIEEIKVNCGGRKIDVLADLKSLFVIKNDIHLKAQGIAPFSVHRIYRPGDWQLGNFIKGFYSLAEAKNFIRNKVKTHAH
ncbi:hypothetical protein [Acinetobacter ursingii]|uniref:hypothetical protein n=1 Tax=Acinetobacter ursingii TaxID=108980 RepID=UPI0030094434